MIQKNNNAVMGDDKKKKENALQKEKQKNKQLSCFFITHTLTFHPPTPSLVSLGSKIQYYLIHKSI